RDLRDDGSSGFWLQVPIARELAGRSHRLRLSLGGQTLLDRQLTLVQRRAAEPVRAPLAICLTTYNPDPALFRRQIDSLRAQTVRDWICFVQDDRSQPERFAEIERV